MEQDLVLGWSWLDLWQKQVVACGIGKLKVRVMCTLGHGMLLGWHCGNGGLVWTHAKFLRVSRVGSNHVG